MVDEPSRIHLDRGVTATFDGYDILIWTADQEHTIRLSPKAVRQLITYRNDLERAIKGDTP